MEKFFTKNSFEIFNERIYGGKEVYDQIDANVTHIHGTVENRFIFGVDNSDQIKKKDFQKNEDIRLLIDKEYITQEVFNEEMDACIQKINDSAFICIYGMSIGETDSFWWKKIMKWLQASSEHHLFYFKYDPALRDPFNRIAGRIPIAERENRQAFFRYADISDETVITQIKKQIHVAFNSDIFKEISN